MVETEAWSSAPWVLRKTVDLRPLSEGFTMTEKRAARKRAPARVGGRGKLDETARVHPYRTVEERVARAGLARGGGGRGSGHLRDQPPP